MRAAHQQVQATQSVTGNSQNGNNDCQHTQSGAKLSNVDYLLMRLINAPAATRPPPWSSMGTEADSHGAPLFLSE